MSKVEPGWWHPHSGSVPVALVVPHGGGVSSSPPLPVAVMAPSRQHPLRSLRSRSAWPRRCPPLQQRPRSGGTPMAVAHRSSSGVPDGGGIPRWQHLRTVFVPHGGGVPGAAAPSGSCVPTRGDAILVPRLPAVYLRKLADEEQPLRLRLLAGPSEKALSFVLKENESGEVNVSVAGEARCRAAVPCGRCDVAALCLRSGTPSPCPSCTTSCASCSARRTSSCAASATAMPAAVGSCKPRWLPARRTDANRTGTAARRRGDVAGSAGRRGASRSDQ